MRYTTLILLAILAVGCTSISKKEDNAKNHAEKLGLKNPLISCDESTLACGCTISWETPDGRRAQTFACCMSGCE